ncbi:hypothetical protein M231_02629 [Tremella mesenterica]|uniref:Ras GEF n=1 Tax=Tremella mesenterica TaxID=5217 RepID=A0A4Q1BQG4_TREME|nr:uncharacterized protein TREMEDRAFT_68182 [Tremella mesenterica DSM 1558]EIW70717.1 hypothetical protein TREMEDRAFT_68182 [Tremella mesenterica DSM 1558]RXK40171.1 hypothetical protein M231_02629 [Tremella mesenterica]
MSQVSPGSAELPPSPIKDLSHDSSQVALLQSARQKLSNKDRAAMRRLRSQMDLSDSGSSKSGSPLSPGFPNGVGPSTGLRTRRSTLSRHLDEPQLSLSELQPDLLDRTPRPPAHNPVMSDADLVIPIVGHAGVGKTKLLEKALRTWDVATRDVDFNGVTVTSHFVSIQPSGKIKHPWKVNLLEMDIATLRKDSIDVWPAGLRSVSAAIFCYDATRRNTLDGLEELVERLSSQGLPIVIFACKSDPGVELEITAAEGNILGEPYNVGLIEVSALSSEGKSKMRNGLRWLLYKLEQRSRKLPRVLAVLFADHLGRHQRKIAVSLQPIQTPTGLILPTGLDALTSPDSDTSSGADRIMWRHGLTLTPADGQEAGSDTRSSSSSLQWMMGGPLAASAGGADETAGNMATGGRNLSSMTALSSLSMQAESSQAVEPPPHVSLEDLLGQLFAAIVSTEDEAFVDAFFLTYRRFCFPQVLMREFLDRYVEVERHAVSRDVKLWALMKITGALIKWTNTYPGDVKNEETHTIFLQVIRLNLKNTFMSHLTEDLIRIEQSLSDVEDVDTSWALKTTEGSSVASITSPTELVIDNELLYELDSSLGRSSVGTAATPKESTPSLASSMGVDNPESSAMARQRSTSNPPRPPLPHPDDLDAHRWSSAVSTLLSSDPRTFAAELTKLQWELFASIRPRDVLRYDLGKEQTGPVARAIHFFNHLSRLVSTLVLANPKAKHRARVYEQFVMIARQLRRNNNYDSLHAVLTGLQETSVHRLGQTRATVHLGSSVERDFQSHLKLMDPRAGFVLYRRALQADISHGRPAIPLMATIISLISRLHSVRREDVREDGAIQWDKFARFGQILSVITECQQKGPMMNDPPSPAFRSLIHDTPVIMNEDALFERSKQLEPSGSSGSSNVFRRLANLGL